MDDLTMNLVQLCHRNRDGSYGTQTNRRRGLSAMSKELNDLGYKLPAAGSLKPKHIEALVERWLDADTSEASIRNRLTWLRWWAEKVNKPNVVNRDNAAYGVADRGAVTRNRAQVLDAAKLPAIDCPFIQTSILLQVAFGLRREEAMKFQPQPIELNLGTVSRLYMSLKVGAPGVPRGLPLAHLPVFSGLRFATGQKTEQRIAISSNAYALCDA